MKVSTILDHIDSRHIALSKFQRSYAAPATGAQKALFNLAWPEGLRVELNAPVAVLLNESADILALASGADFRCFTSPADFRAHIETEFLHLEVA